jgi:hypothetical protein
MLAEIQEDNLRFKLLKEELQKASHWNAQYAETIATVTETMDSLVWKKDSDNRFILANQAYCKNYFGLEPEAACLEEIAGREEAEILKSLYAKETTIELCGISDAFINGKPPTPYHFIESGYLDGKFFIFYLIKTPLYSKETGEFKGTAGIGWDFLSRMSKAMKMINEGMIDGTAQQLLLTKRSFSYSMDAEKNTCDIFKHICINGYQPGKPVFCTESTPCVKRDRAGL